MPLETGTTIADLVATNPAATDGLGQADDHTRLLKTVLKTTFPNFAGVLTASPAELDAAATAVAGIPWDTAQIADDAVTYAKMQNVSATDKLLGRSSSGAGNVEEIACTAAGRALLDDVDAAAQRTTLGLSTVAATGAYSDLSGKPTLGTAAALNVGTGASQVVQLNGSAQLPAVSGVNLTNIPYGSITGRDFVQIASTTLGIAADEIAFTSGIDSTYREYEFEFHDLLAASGTPTLNVQVSTDGGSTWLASTTYQYGRDLVSTLGTDSLAGSGGTSVIPLGPLASSANVIVAGKLSLLNPAGSNHKVVLWQMWASAHYIGSAKIATTSAINAIRFSPGGGINFAAGSSITMYGKR